MRNRERALFIGVYGGVLQLLTGGDAYQTSYHCFIAKYRAGPLFCTLSAGWPRGGCAHAASLLASDAISFRAAKKRWSRLLLVTFIGRTRALVLVWATAITGGRRRKEMSYHVSRKAVYFERPLRVMCGAVRLFEFFGVLFSPCRDETAALSVEWSMLLEEQFAHRACTSMIIRSAPGARISCLWECFWDLFINRISSTIRCTRLSI